MGLPGRHKGLMILLTGSIQYMSVTDRQADRRTEGRTDGLRNLHSCSIYATDNFVKFTYESNRNSQKRIVRLHLNFGKRPSFGEIALASVVANYGSLGHVSILDIQCYL